MHVKTRVKLSFMLITFLVLIIVAAQFLVLYKIRENNDSAQKITALLTLQENMNTAAQGLLQTDSLTKLAQKDRQFLQHEHRFERLKEDFIIRDRDDLFDRIITDLHKRAPVQKSLQALFAHERQIETLHAKITKLHKKKIGAQKRFDKLYPVEKEQRETLRKQILDVNDLSLLQRFSKMEYYSKEALYQYRDKKHTKLWMDALQNLPHTLPVFANYRETVKKISTAALAIADFTRKEQNAADTIGRLIEKNKTIHAQIQSHANTIEQRFLTQTFYLILCTAALILLFIAVLAFFVNKNVGLTFDQIERKVREGLAEIKNLNKEITDTQKEVVFTMGAIGESRSRETGNHVKRVAEYSRLLAQLYGLPESEVQLLKQASPMHDIGKVAIPDAILNKPGKLDKQEWETMQTHAQLGEQMLAHSKRPLLQTAAIVAGQHHEKYDGSGYPRGLQDTQIHIYGRITALADVFDALGSDRVYKKAWEDEKIFALFEQERGNHFDPLLIDLFFAHLDQFLTIRERFKDKSL